MQYGPPLNQYSWSYCLDGSLFMPTIKRDPLIYMITLNVIWNVLPKSYSYVMAIGSQSYHRVFFFNDLKVKNPLLHSHASTIRELIPNDVVDTIHETPLT